MVICSNFKDTGHVCAINTLRIKILTYCLVVSSSISNSSSFSISIKMFLVMLSITVVLLDLMLASFNAVRYP